MGERRKRKSLWDKEAETKSFPGTSDNNNWTGKDQHPSQDSELYHEISASGSHGAPKFTENAKPSPESIENDPVAQMNENFTKIRENAPEVKEIGSENSCYQNIPPNFKHTQSLENDRSHSRRYKVRGRSRSRSRSRTRGRRHSRSLSRGRERERERTRGRSRSRSRSEGDARGRTESQYSGWSDRRSQHEKSTEVCSDFSAGRCRRGSQCKYLHSKDTSHRDGGLGGAETSESWRSRESHGNNSKQSYGRGPRAELKGDVSDSYAEDEQFQNKSKNAPRKNFVIGKCRWGDTCRFSHHFASDEPSVEGSKHLSPDKDTEHQPYRSRKLLCKYFSAGKCDLDNCRFSHGDSKSNSLEGALGGHGKIIDENHSHDQGNKRNGLMRDDQGSTIDNYSTGHDNRLIHSLGNNISWRSPQQTDNIVDKSKESVCRAGNGSYGGELGTTESVRKENTTAKQELLILHGSQLQNQDENMNVEGQNNLLVDQTVFVNAWHVSPVSHIQQQNHGVVENTSFHPDNMDDVKGLKNTTGSVLLSGQNMHQNGENILPGNSCISGESGSEQMPAFKGAEMHQVTNLNLQYLIQKHQNAIQMTGMPASQSFPSLAISEHAAQYTGAPLSNALQQVDPVKNSVMLPNQRFENEHSGKNAVMEVHNSTGIPISISNAPGHVPLNTVNTQFNPIEISHEPVNPMENGRSVNENGHQLAEGNTRPAEPLPPTFIVGMGPNNSEVDHSGSSKLQQETPAENPEIDQVKRGTDEQSKGVQNVMHAETLDSHGKGDEIIANKDDKDIRLFKNSLIEFVKDILKPTWKEGRMSREVHKTIVKKVVDKITSTIQTDHIPMTQEKVEQYLSFSKPKIAKLVQAYVDRCLKPDS